MKSLMMKITDWFYGVALLIMIVIGMMWTAIKGETEDDSDY